MATQPRLTHSDDVEPRGVSGSLAVVARVRPHPAEVVLLVGVLLTFQRTPLLFFRRKAGEWFASLPPTAMIWQDDGIIRAVWFTLEVAVVALAVSRCRLSRLKDEWPLVVFVLFAYASTLWSVEPAVTHVRAVFLGGTVMVGWYLGRRFSLAEQAAIVAAAAAAGAVLSIVAVYAWPESARLTNGRDGLWSGIYVNRNLLANAMAIGLLSLGVAAWRAPRRYQVAALGIASLEVLLIVKSGSRTGPVAIAAAVVIVLVVVALRLARSWGVTDRIGAAISVAATVVVTFLGSLLWPAVVDRLDRDATLTRRTDMWAIDRSYIEMRPWRGYGYEAIWTHPPIVEAATAAFGAYPYHAHNGYYEVLLGVGVIGFGMFALFLLVTVVRAFRTVWVTSRVAGIWPLLAAAYVIVANLSESFFVPNEALLAVLVAASVAAGRVVREPESADKLTQPLGGRASISR